MPLNTINFSYTGFTQTFTVPNGVSNITIKAWGAGGNVYNSNSISTTIVAAVL